MERLEALISKLSQQYQQNADPALLLGTVQLLQFELTKLQTNKAQSLGTAKVAVILPRVNILPQSTVIAPQHEKYAPQPVDKILIKEVKEMVTVDAGSISVVQKNGQLDMMFDPMTEIPTLSHQPQKEVNDIVDQAESLNEKLKQGKTELMQTLKETPVKDLRKAIGINDRFLFIKELFRGDENMYERSIKTINSFSIYPEAEYWISRELKLKLGWSNDLVAVQYFDHLVRRRFS